MMLVGGFIATTALPITTAPSVNVAKGSKIAATIGRICVALGVLALIGAWITQLAQSGLRLAAASSTRSR